ncbi:hypothetical protein DPMN_042201 [Dreissena polymorpha]|uniref:Uncharacterized protein n=1 Tax=Dreissena polymorpha TaxID=45954 RepID=A0A9D4D0N3_DREPO|nr:hypothetical protein DPMN_042201 [Dreissena polymorpha]
MNLLTKSHEDRTINVASRVLTRFYYSHKRNKSTALRVQTAHLFLFKVKRGVWWSFGVGTGDGLGKTKNAPPFGSHVFQANVTIFELIKDIIETNLLNKFHKDWTINVASRVLTRKNAQPLGSHISYRPIF